MNSLISIKDIILLHYKTYPLMVEIDYIKLIYQHSYGISHLLDTSSKKYLINEYNEFNHNISINEYIDIGNNLVRLSLDKTNLLEETIYELLYFTLDNSKSSYNSFIDNIDILYSCIDEYKLPINKDKIKLLLENNNYYKDISPRHSNQYKSIYNPHYRIVNKDKLLEILK